MNIAFIIGTGRCGSSLIHEIMARHNSVGFISNIEDNLSFLNFTGRYNNALFRTRLGNWTRKGRLRFAPSEAYRLIEAKVSSIYSNSCRDLTAEDLTPWLSARFRQFFHNRHERQGKELFLHKYTGWPRIEFFSQIFPEARFVHVIRDGRAVANSWLQMPWWGGYRGPENWLWGELPQMYAKEWDASGRSFAVLSGIAWKILMDAFESAVSRVPVEHYLMVRYEDFVADPRKITGEMLSFLGLEWNAEFERHFSRQHIDASRARAYEQDLSSDQLRELENCLRNKLRDYGYVD